MERERRFSEEKLPIGPPLNVIEHRTISKGFGWWAAVVLVESWGRKQLCLYLWQKKGDKWARKQKFTIHDQQKWELLADAVEDMVKELP
ncbi:MAG: hypothetical protein AUJ75_04055 [Candidatus Omnitrophica bacterium CG1_02_49_10]|nr:MAG: hypothetical protein AUJ75_04055 [Candidatus Omnitrophica bacterium CG1_02_49_10]